MSLFKTLQSSPATVTIFHNTKIPLSNKLYDILNKTYESLPKKPKYDFQIDLMKNRMPTFDQYEIFVRKFLKSEQDKKILHNCFPFLNEKQTILINDQGKHCKINGSDWSNKIFSEFEYQLIYETFNALENNFEKDKLLPSQPSDIFKAPLVVDWDQDMLAGDVQTLNELLAKYTN
ncbi:hypothetical protein KGF56_001722 [Candida oxycetoniae]|uniref:Uncharacterized protein n=1 Tax=Candida oxycetoniae TaxID=497107 RepID=A0AAI9SZY7_9ASCO|nr:uncharacterized protein KGF56_001722 [Candida oxycetoniae]KAI3405475.2 hypothetical protein KGF56_001722 [Candida oxycetoniae]